MKAISIICFTLMCLLSIIGLGQVSDTEPNKRLSPLKLDVLWERTHDSINQVVQSPQAGKASFSSTDMQRLLKSRMGSESLFPKDSLSSRSVNGRSLKMAPSFQKQSFQSMDPVLLESLLKQFQVENVAKRNED
ncbi:MAG: hypothetical protein AAF694_27040 [Bacteroidota bacterium]